MGCHVQDEDGYPVITRDTDPAEVADRVDAFPVSSKGYISKVSWWSSMPLHVACRHGVTYLTC